MDGSFIRHILESCRQRWSNPYNLDGTIDRGAMANATESVLGRMRDLLAEVGRVEEWRAHLDLRSSTGNTFRTEAKLSMEKKIAKVAKDYRFWLYQELVLLRSELWDRYHLRHDQVLARYRTQRLCWQKCWFRESHAPTEAIMRIRRIIDGKVRTGVDTEVHLRMDIIGKHAADDVTTELAAPTLFVFPTKYDSDSETLVDESSSSFSSSSSSSNASTVYDKVYSGSHSF
jgi:hypothetical protein